LQPYSHGRNENADPEWPPSPLRLAQALVAAAAGRWNERRSLSSIVPAIHWLEALPPPGIVGAPALPSKQPYRLYVPDNVADKVAGAWSRGRDASIADYRTEKDVRSAQLDGDSVHYLYSLPPADADSQIHIETLTAAARSITHLGWGIDMAVGDARIMTEHQALELPGHRWHVSPVGGTLLRIPRRGTLDDLMRKHADFLNRVTDEGFRPIPPLRVFDVVRYRRNDEPVQRPYRVFELRNTDGSRFRYPHRKLIHIAGMVRHLAIDAMKTAVPRGVPDHWVETYIAGHRRKGNVDAAVAGRCSEDSPNETQQQVFADDDEHRQLSYLPLPSMGHSHADPGVRRIMIAAPTGDDASLDHVARRLAGQTLKPQRGDEFAGREPPLLVPVRRDNVARFYTEPANVWHTITPVILPGHDGHKPAKTRALIERALIQSGIDQACEFEWSTHSRFPQAYSAHKYDKHRRPQGYIRPGYLLSQTAVHLTLRFHGEMKIPGPIAVGAGRHCGFGLMACVDE
jgi:CRISPR-associated protein Csb2